MIMILDVDVTAERRHYNTHRPAGDTTTLGPKGRQTYEPSGRRPVNPKNPQTEGVSTGAAPSTLTPKVCLMNPFFFSFPRVIMNPWKIII